jgi:hypothetical protein
MKWIAATAALLASIGLAHADPTPVSLEFDALVTDFETEFSVSGTVSFTQAAGRVTVRGPQEVVFHSWGGCYTYSPECSAPDPWVGSPIGYEIQPAPSWPIAIPEDAYRVVELLYRDNVDYQGNGTFQDRLSIYTGYEFYIETGTGLTRVEHEFGIDVVGTTELFRVDGATVSPFDWTQLTGGEVVWTYSGGSIDYFLAYGALTGPPTLVPEAGTLAMFLAGGLVLASAARRRRPSDAV